MRVFVAGHRGMVGSAILAELEKRPEHSPLVKPRSELDLRERDAVFDYFSEEQPEAVILAAAKVGGIGANQSSPVGFLSENLQIQTNVMDAAFAVGVEKFIFLGSSCIYPKNATQPLHEEDLLGGKLEPTNEAYAIAKIAGLKLIDAYRKQGAKKWVTLMPTNLYGPGDNFDLHNSHVIPAMTMKIKLAKASAKTRVELWGTGKPLREFLHSKDLAEAVLLCLDNEPEWAMANVGSGEEISIADLAQLIAKEIGFQGDIYWNSEMPDGTPRKLMDSSRLRGLGWRPTIDLAHGLKKYIANSPAAGNPVEIERN